MMALVVVVDHASTHAYTVHMKGALIYRGFSKILRFSSDNNV